MNRIVELIAPTGWIDGLIKGGALLFLLNVLNYFVNKDLRAPDLSQIKAILNTSIVALPFLALAMTLLWHQRKLQGQLIALATTDMLTGLPNRRAFMDRAAARLGDPTAADQRLMMVMIDADPFKKINDSYGHAVGDLCLQAIADHLRRCLREGDLVGRIGGEEFSVMMSGPSTEHLVARGKQLCGGVSVRPAPDAPPVQLTLSVGAAPSTPDLPLDHAMSRADEALLAAKLRGRAQLVLWPDVASPGEPAREIAS